MSSRNELFVEKVLVWITELPFEDQPRQSSNFSLMGSEWYLQFSYLKGKSYHALSLHRATVGNEPQHQTEFKAKTYITEPTEIGNGEREVENVTIQQTVTTLWSSGGSYKFIFDYLPSLYKMGAIKFVCKFYGQPQSAFQLEIGTDPPMTCGTGSSDGPSDLECLSLDLGRLLEGGQSPDVRLNCGGESFPAHRTVLAARSEVFAAMFRNQMSENETGGVDVKDFQPDVVRHFLQYLYAGKLSAESGEAAASLFAMADKYAVESLKKTCSRWIVSNLTEGNCIEYLTVAELHQSEVLKKKVVAFICDHPMVMLGEGWADFSEKNPKLAVEVYHCFVQSKAKA